MPADGARASDTAATLLPGTPGDAGTVRRLAGSTTLYLAALILPRVVRLIAVPLLVHAVAPDVYGTFATLWSLVGFGYGICDLGLGNAAVRLAPEAASSEQRRSLFATMLLARGAAALLVSAIVLAAHAPLARLTTGNAADGPFLVILFLSLPLSAALDGYASELRSREAHAPVALLTVARTLMVNGSTLFLVLALGLGLAGLCWARPLTDVLVFALGSVLCWRFVHGRFDVARLRELWRFGWPLGVLTVLVTVRGLDRPLIRALTSVDHVAAYDLAMRLVGPIALPTLALGFVLQPVVYRHADSPNTPQMIELFVRGYVAVFAIVAMGVSVLAPEIIALIAPAPYHGAIRAVPALMFFQFVDGLTRAAGIGAELAKRTHVWATATTVGVVVGMSLVPILVPRFEVGGAGLALFIGSATGTLVTYFLSRKVSGLVLPVPRGVAIAVLGTVLATDAVWRPWPLTARLALALAFALFSWRLSGTRIAALRTLLAAR